MRRILIIAVACVLILLLLAVRESLMASPKRETAVYFFDVGQGDAAMIVGPSGQQIVVDGGPNLRLLEHLERTMPFLDRTIDILVISHPDMDHIVALPEVLRRYEVKHVLMTGIAKQSARYQEILSLVAERKIPVIFADPRKDILYPDGLLLDIAWPDSGLVGTEREDANNTSIVMRAIYGNDSVLFTGDMEEVEEREVLSSGADIESDVLKVAHHGSKTSSSTGFLMAAKASMAVISVGSDNSYGHPAPFIVERLENMGMTIRRTDREGTVTLRLDGK